MLSELILDLLIYLVTHLFSSHFGMFEYYTEHYIKLHNPPLIAKFHPLKQLPIIYEHQLIILT